MADDENELRDSVNLYAEDNMRLLELLGMGKEAKSKKQKTAEPKKRAPKPSLRLSWQRTLGVTIDDRGREVQLKAVALQDEWAFARLFGYLAEGAVRWTVVLQHEGGEALETMGAGAEGTDGSRLLLDLVSGETQDAHSRVEPFFALPESGYFPRGTMFHFTLSHTLRKVMIGINDELPKPAFRLQSGVGYVPVVALRQTGQELSILDMRIEK
jgi:hypothetical protein